MRDVNFLQNILINLSGKFAILLIALGVDILVARGFGPAGKGQYALLIFWTSVIHIAFHVGFSRACIYYYHQPGYQQNKVVGITAQITVLGGGVLGLIAFLLLDQFSGDELFNTPVSSIQTLVLASPLVIGVLAIANINRALENFVESNLVQIVNRLGVFLAIAAILHFQFESSYMVYALIVGAALSSLVGWYRLIAYGRVFIRSMWSFELFRTMLSYGIRAASFNLVTLINTRIDHLLIGSLLGLKDLGFYSAAVVLAEVSSKFVIVLTEVMFPRSSALDGKRADDFTAQLLRVTLFFTFIILCTVGILADVLVRTVFGDQFSTSTVVLLLLLPGGLFVNITLILGTDLSARGRPGAVAVASIVGVVLIVSGNYLFTPTHGIIAAAIVATVSNMITMVTLLMFHLGQTQNSIMKILIIRMKDVEKIIALAFRLLRRA